MVKNKKEKKSKSKVKGSKKKMLRKDGGYKLKSAQDLKDALVKNTDLHKNPVLAQQIADHIVKKGYRLESYEKEIMNVKVPCIGIKLEQVQNVENLKRFFVGLNVETSHDKDEGYLQIVGIQAKPQSESLLKTAVSTETPKLVQKELSLVVPADHLLVTKPALVESQVNKSNLSKFEALLTGVLTPEQLKDMRDTVNAGGEIIIADIRTQNSNIDKIGGKLVSKE